MEPIGSSKWMGGSAMISLLERRRLMMNTNSSMISYIRSVNGAYIDTGITADNTVKVIIWARNFNPAVGGVLFGSRIDVRNAAFSLNSNSLQNTGRIRIDYGSAQTQVNDQFKNLASYHKYELYQGVLKIDDITVGTASSSAFSNNLNIYLFGLNNNGTPTLQFCSSDICSCQIYKNGILVRDFKVVNSSSVGLYDEVSGTLFTNAGSGSFAYGRFNPYAYIPLEYIECTKQQYFDTGIYGTKSLINVTKFRVTDNTKTFHRVFGYRLSDPLSQYELMIGDTTTANRVYNWRDSFGSYDINAGSSQTNNDLVFYKDYDNKAYLYKNNIQLGSTVTGGSSDFTTSGTLSVADNGRHNQLQYAYTGRLYYVMFGSQRSFVPAKVNGIAGMYDTYNDVFYRSESGTDFVAGPEL